MRNAVLLFALLTFLGGELALFGSAEVFAAQPAKKKKKRTKKAASKEEQKRERSVVKAVDEPEGEEKKEGKAADDEISPDAPPPMTPEQLEEQRVEEAKRKLEAERRQQSRVTPGAPSRWSNRGAMVPVASPVPVTAELPERAVPIEGTVATPGQSLLGAPDEDILSARLSFGYYHIETKEQDRYFVQPTFDPTFNYTLVERIPGKDRDIDFLRGRATFGYDRIAGSDFGVHLDVEYRPQLAGSRFTDYRLNEAYVSYGLTEFRNPNAPFWGVALGRLAIREAGYAQADGLALRFRITDWLRLGAFGGVTGNPYGYNWNLRTTEVFSIDWYTGGAFVSLQLPQLIVNLAGVMTYANVAVNATGVERGYVYLDGAWLILPELNFVVNGWFDFQPGGQIVQNVTGSFTWSPFDDLSLSLGGGRFATLLYAVSADPTRCNDALGLNALGCSFVANGENIYPGTNKVIVGSDNQPIVPYDAVLMTTVYNSIWLRGGYRIFRDLEVNAKVDTLIRDASVHQDELLEETKGTVKPAALRLVPGAGVRYQNPDILDARIDFGYIVDEESQADAYVSAGLGRGLFGLYLLGDVRYYFGDVGGLDTGVVLSYTLPRDWFPGALTVRGMFRFYRENVSIVYPTETADGLLPNRLPDGTVDGWNPIEKQDSLLGFAGIEWRL